MTRVETVAELVAHASARALQPPKFVDLARAFISARAVDAETAAHLLAHTLLGRLTHDGHAPPALLVGYLLHLVLADVVPPATAIVHLLYALPVTPPALATLSSVLVQPPAPVTLPPTLDVPELPGVPSRSTPALTLALPLFRACQTAAAPTPATVVLAARVAAALPPSPPLDAGVEAAQLLHDLPEDVARLLRANLAGLINDAPPVQPIYVDDGPAQMPPAFAQIPAAAMGADMAALSASLAAAPVDGPLQLPLVPALALALAAADRATWSDRPAADLVRLGPSLSTDPRAFAEALVAASLSGGRLNSARGAVFATVTLPSLLSTWRGDDARYGFPDDVRGAFASALAAASAELDQADAAWGARYAALTQAMDDDGNTFTEPDGWALLSVRESFVRQCITAGVLPGDALPDLVPAPSEPPCTGDALADRVAGCPVAHLPALAAFITRAHGAAAAFASEAMQALGADAPIPESLLRNIAASPELLAALALHTPPTALLQGLATRLLDQPENRAAWVDDPQGYLIRYGAGVVLVEAICAEFDLLLPAMLDDARSAHDLCVLQAGEQALVNSWVKALYGSDGIDDQILLATSPRVFSRLATTLIDQSIVAAANGAIDMDTLRSGLSYFSQPLISWSLGGIVGWLCGEIERKGLLAGLHLVVVHCLVLDPAFPDPLLRVHATALSRIIDPLHGSQPLDAVFQTASFDAGAVRDRLLSVDALREPAPRDECPSPLEVREILQLLRTVGLGPLDWARILPRIARAAWPDPSRLLQPALTDVLFSLDAPVDAIALLFLVALSPPAHGELAHALVAAALPALFHPRSLVTHAALPPNGAALNRLVRAVLVGSDASDTGLALEAALRAVHDGRKPAGETAMTDVQRGLWDGLVGALAADAEVVARWPGLGSLR